MATVHIREIEKWLTPEEKSENVKLIDGFLEIRFDEPATSTQVVDDEMRNKVITCDSPQGVVTIKFDDLGYLRSVDIS